MNPLDRRGRRSASWDDFVFTQEQRGNSESVVCYRADSGKEVWARGEAGKHTDQMSGPGPRATLTYANGKLYAVSASGVVSCLSREQRRFRFGMRISLNDSARPNRTSGWATSPLVVGDLIIIHPGSHRPDRVWSRLDAATGATQLDDGSHRHAGVFFAAAPRPLTVLLKC